MEDIAIPQNARYSQTFYSSLFKLPSGERIKNCIQCGSCSGVCPFGSQMDYPPGRLIAYLRAGLFERVVQVDTPWMCISCFACTQICPREIPITAALMTRTKEELVLAGKVPAELQTALENSQRYGNPLGESPRKRSDWTRDLKPEIPILRTARRPVDVLWFVGDYSSYHPRVQSVSKALAGILHTLGIDFGILGPEENSDGDSQRLAGEYGLFEILAEKNGKAFAQYEFNEIITTDPHSYNALKNEYPKLGISYPVKHHTEFLAERLEIIKPLLTKNMNAKVTYHDPCYLGRVNKVYEAPRMLLNAIPGIELVEMAHNRTFSLCCGGGGGGMWLDGFLWEKTRTRTSEWRVQEAIAAGANILAVACPYEPPRFEDAAKTVNEREQLIVKDIVELLAEAMAGQTDSNV